MFLPNPSISNGLIITRSVLVELQESKLSESSVVP